MNIEERQEGPKPYRKIIWILIICIAGSILMYAWIFYGQNLVGSKSKLKQEEIIAQDISSLMIQAETLLASGKDREALDVYDALLKRDPKNEQVLLMSGVIAFQLENFDKASERLSAVVKSTGEKPAGPSKMRAARAHFLLGRIFLRQKKESLAASAFKKSLELDTVNAETLTALADIELAKKRNEEAIKYLELATRVDPGFLEAFVLLEKAYLAVGDQEKAKEAKSWANSIKGVKRK